MRLYFRRLDQSKDISSSTTSSSSKRLNIFSQESYKRQKHNKKSEVPTRAPSPMNTGTGSNSHVQDSYTDSEGDVFTPTNVGRKNRGVNRKKTSDITEETESSENYMLSQVNKRINKTDERPDKRVGFDDWRSAGPVLSGSC